MAHMCASEIRRASRLSTCRARSPRSCNLTGDVRRSQSDGAAVCRAAADDSSTLSEDNPTSAVLVITSFFLIVTGASLI